MSIIQLNNHKSLINNSHSNNNNIQMYHLFIYKAPTF